MLLIKKTLKEVLLSHIMNGCTWVCVRKVTQDEAGKTTNKKAWQKSDTRLKEDPTTNKICLLKTSVVYYAIWEKRNSLFYGSKVYLKRSNSKKEFYTRAAVEERMSEVFPLWHPLLYFVFSTRKVIYFLYVYKSN